MYIVYIGIALHPLPLRSSVVEAVELMFLHRNNSFKIILFIGAVLYLNANQK